MHGRRDFLKGIAGGIVTGFPLVVPASALGRGAAAAPSDRIVMGAIGVGRQGSGDMRGFLNNPDVRVLAICDVQQANRERSETLVNNRYGSKECVTYNDYREVLDRRDIDVVLIATGERWHPLIAVEAANAGKHMYCEKPLALSVAEAKAVREAVNRNGVAFQFGTQQRSSFMYRQAVELVRNGRIGQLKTIMVGTVRGPSNRLVGTPKEPPPGFDYDRWLGPSPWAPYSDMRVSTDAWLFISDYGLGCMDGAWGIHDIDIAQWVNDADKTNPIDVEGTATFYKDIRDTPQEWTIEHNYANGVKLIHMDMVSARKRAPEFMSMPSNGATVIYGTEGWIYVSRQGIITKPASLASEKIGPNQVQVIRSNDHRRNLLNAIRTGQPTICGVEGAVRAQSVIQQEYISLCLDRKLRWDPVREEFIGDAEANRRLSRPMRSPWHI
jgi:predicted dehydrogenase